MRDEEKIKAEITNHILTSYGKDITQTDLVEDLKMSKSKVSRACKILLTEGTIKVEKMGKYNVLKLTDPSKIEIETETKIETETDESIPETETEINNVEEDQIYGSSPAEPSLFDKEYYETLKNELPEREAEIRKLEKSNRKLRAEIETQKELLENQSSTIKEGKVNLETFTEFSQKMMKGATKTGTNAYRKGEIVFRRSDLKNIYIIYTEKILGMKDA